MPSYNYCTPSNLDEKHSPPRAPRSLPLAYHKQHTSVRWRGSRIHLKRWQFLHPIQNGLTTAALAIQSHKPCNPWTFPFALGEFLYQAQSHIKNPCFGDLGYAIVFELLHWIKNDKSIWVQMYAHLNAFSTQCIYIHIYIYHIYFLQ